MCNESYYALREAIVLQAVKDFRKAYRRLKRFPDDQHAANQVKEITEFFCSEYFCLLSDADGSWVMEKIMDQIEEEQRHEKK